MAGRDSALRKHRAAARMRTRPGETLGMSKHVTRTNPGRGITMHAKRNLAHRMGRWSGTHPWTAILGWLAFVVISFVAIPSFVTTDTLDEAELGVGESGRAALVLDQAFPPSLTPATEMILVQTTRGRLAAADLSAV